MKAIVFAGLLLVSSLVPAAVVQGGNVAPVSFNFTGVSVTVFAQATYKNLLGRDFVISPDLVNSDKRITISVKSVDALKLPGFVDSLLLSQGVRAVEKDGVYYLDLSRGDELGKSSAGDSVKPGAAPSGAPVDPPVPDQVELYQPLNRSADFLATVINGVFKPGKELSEKVSQAEVARSGGSQIVLQASKSRMVEVLRIIRALDVGVKSVEVAASFVEVTTSKTGTRGLSLVSSVLSRRFGVTASAGSVLVNAGSYQLVLDALAGDGRFKQVSNSRVVGDDLVRMSLSVGDETPTLASSGKDNQGNEIQSIVYRPSGVILDVLPTVLGSGGVSLVVDGQVSAFQATVTGVTGSPTLSKRQVKTSVSLEDGQVLLIGGLDDSKVMANESGFSFLPSTWRSKTSSDTHTDLVLILTAKVLRN